MDPTAALLPRPPTDNLYKFVAVFGLVLMGFGLYLNHFSWSIRERAQDHDYRAVELSFDLAKLAQKRASESIERRRKREAGVADPQPSYDDRDRDRIKSESDRLALSARRGYDRAILYQGFGAVLFGLALVMVWSGFRAWYARVQLPMNELLLLELGAARRKAQEAEASSANVAGSLPKAPKD